MKNTNPLEDLQEIRKMMEGSTKFLSLSGLSGVFAGIVALVGCWFAYQEIDKFWKLSFSYHIQGRLEQGYDMLEARLAVIAICILVVAVGGGVLFTWLKGKKQGKSIFTPIAFKLALSLMTPLVFGGLFCIGLYRLGGPYTDIIPAATLIFYGLALLNASKYVHVDIKYLALSEMLLGVLAMFFLYEAMYISLVFWALGFGVLHILYGTIMYFKYDRKQTE